MTDFPDLKIKALVNFPAEAVGRTGINIVKQDGRFYLDLNYQDFARVSSLPPADLPNLYSLFWNVAKQQFVLVPIALVGTGGV